jgi:hypothetical protein
MPTESTRYEQDEAGQWWYWGYNKKQRYKCIVRVCLYCKGDFPTRVCAPATYCSKVCSNRDVDNPSRPNRGGKLKTLNPPRERRTRYKDAHGYISCYQPDHPAGKKSKGFVKEHRLVMEEYLGRYLTKDETVHHRNGIRDDNRIENLELWASKHHSGQRVEDLVAWAVELLACYLEPGDTIASGDKQISVQMAA